MKMLGRTIFFVLLASSLTAQESSSEFFTVKTGAIPEDFFKRSAEEIKREAKDQSIINEKEAFTIYENASYEITDLIKSGNIYFNDELTDYIQNMVNELVGSEKDMAGKIRVLVSRSNSANAFCAVDGTIIVNVSLLARVENASQLAGIISHELSHFKKKHSLTRFRQNTELEKQEGHRNNSKGNSFRSLAYSREYEFEADASAVVWMSTQTKYDASEYSKALELVTQNVIDSIPLDLSALFNTEIFKVDTSIITEKLVKKELKRNTNRQKSFIKIDDEDYETHPDGEKRVLAAKEILQSLNYKIPSLPNDPRFVELKRKSEFETCENLFNGGQYLESLHSALALEAKYPGNITASTLTVKNLFWLCRLKENGIMSAFMENIDVEKSPSKAKLKLFFQKTKSADLGKFLYTYVKQKYENEKDNSDLLFYMGAAAEMHLGKDAAAIHYRIYSEKYPNGKFIEYVSQKLS